jgi:hypothetical protein
VQRFLTLISDEPWLFGLPVEGEQAFLRELGLELREAFAIGGEESLKRYVTRSDGTQLGATAIAAAMARMAQRADADGPRAHAAGQPPPGGQAVSAGGSEDPPPRASMAEQIRARQRLMSYQIAEAEVAATSPRSA